MRVYITRRLPDAVLEAVRARFDATFRDNTAPMTHDECVAALRDYDAILPTLGDAFRAPAFAEAGEPRCRMLANFGVGYNHIDVEAANAAGITVTNTPGAVTDATADIAMTLLLMSARRAAARGSVSCARARGRAGIRCRCSAPMSPARRSGSSEWEGSARPSRGAAISGSACRWCSRAARSSHLLICPPASCRRSRT